MIEPTHTGPYFWEVRVFSTYTTNFNYASGELTMNLKLLPLDLARPETRASSRQPKQKKEPWELAKSAALEDPNSLDKWDELFRALEQKWEQVAGSEDQKPAVSAAVTSSYEIFLSRFPFLTEYWKQFLIFQYKLSGVDESLKVLEKATKKHPQSVSLWCDYLSATLSVYNTSKEKSEDGIEQIRRSFQKAAKLIGKNFNSDLFWDIYIDFELKNSHEDDLHLLELYLQLIHLPLYQYSKYYNQFMEICKNFPVSDIVTDQDTLKTYLSQFEKKSVAELSVVEQHQIIDTYVYDIFTKNQQKVNAKWEHESSLTAQEFSVRDIEKSAKELEIWLRYIDFEIDNRDRENKLQYELVLSLFERALVPNCFNAKMWQKYAVFVAENLKILQNGDSTVPQYASPESIYERAIFQFLPLDETKIREHYVRFLTESKKFDDANEFLLTSLQKYTSAFYAKNAYIFALRQLTNLWLQIIESEKLQFILEGLVEGFFDRVDRYKKASTEKSEEKSEKPDYEIPHATISKLSRLLNNEGICVVTVAYLQSLNKKPENSTKIRKFYNKFHKNSVFSHSVQFWKFFVDFEGVDHKNLVNLRMIVHHIKTATNLPKKAVDAFIDIYYEITCANLAQAVSLSHTENYLDILVSREAEKSTSLGPNKLARTRLAAHNHFIQDVENQTRKHLSPQEKEKILMDMRLRQLPHPGIFVDQRPEVVNSVHKNGWVSLLDDNLEMPPHPIVKNADKANAPINYPDEQ